MRDFPDSADEEPDRDGDSRDTLRVAVHGLGVEIIAHRGASHDAPENTLTAVRLAWAQNAEAVEVDVQLTADGRLAVIHDLDTRRTTGVSRQVADATLAELQALDAGRWKAPAFAGEMIPSLDQVLALVPEGRRIFVEIKGGPAAVPELARCLARAAVEARRVVVISFDLETCRAAKARLAAHVVCWILERDSPEGRLTSAELNARAVAAGVDGLDVEAAWLDEAWVRAGRAAGLRRFYVWTVDDPKEAERMARWGLDGITTNRPAFIRDALKRV